MTNIESVQKVTETASKNPAEEMERFTPNKDHFDSLMNSSQSGNPSFERVDQAMANNEAQNTEEKNPIFAEENVSSQKSGTATDQDQKRRRQQDDGEVEGVSGTRAKKSGASSTKSTSLMDEVSKLNTNVSKF